MLNKRKPRAKLVYVVLGSGREDTVGSFLRFGYSSWRRLSIDHAEAFSFNRNAVWAAADFGRGDISGREEAAAVQPLWTIESDRFGLDPLHQMPGLNI